MYGELFVDDLNNKEGASYFPHTSLSNETTERTSARTGAVVFMVGIYMAIVGEFLEQFAYHSFSETALPNFHGFRYISN